MFEVPTSLSPSRVEKFTSCPLAFRFASIEKLPEPPTVHTARGTLVHRCLELAFTASPAARTPEHFRASLAQARDELRADPDVALLGLTPEQLTVFDRECADLVDRYLAMEDPTQVRAIGLELRLSAAVGSLSLRGIIDRLELRGDELVVTDYKTGRAPSPNWEQRSLAGVHFYSFLCEQALGRRPDAIRLMYLSSGETIEARPSDQSVRFIATRAAAVWRAVEVACTTGDFQPRPSALCGSCHFRAWCPSFGGDPARAAADLATEVAPVSLPMPA